MGADNQQERLNASWIVGFIDGEGCFFVGINRMAKMKSGFQILPEFMVVQHKRDIGLLYRIRDYFGFGSVTRNHGDRFEFRVRGMINLKKLVQFFEQNPLLTKKQESFRKFSKIIKLMEEKKHLTSRGVNRIREISQSMNKVRI